MVVICIKSLMGLFPFHDQRLYYYALLDHLAFVSKVNFLSVFLFDP